MLLSKTAVENYLRRPFDSFTWMKQLDEQQVWDEINRLRVKPQFKTQPWLHQLICFWIGTHYPQFLFLLDMGLGKTKILLDLMTQAQREKRMKRALVLVPRLINMESWQVAAGEHSNLEPWLVTVQSIEEKYEALLNPQGDFTVIDYAGLHLACSKKVKKKGKNVLQKDASKVAKLARRYDFVAPDESHKVGNHESLWFSIIRELTADARHCFATTGTLFARDLEGIWSQFYLVDRGETFGPNLGLFRKSLFTAKAHPWKGEVLTFNKDMTRQLNKMMAHRSIRYDEREVHDLPLLVRRTVLVTLPEEQQPHYDRAVNGLIAASGGGVAALDAQWLRMRQITSGFLEWSDEAGPHKVVFDRNPKLEALEAIIDEAAGRKVVVSHEYTSTGRLITEMLTKRKIKHEWLYGGTKDPIACKKRFTDDPTVQVFVMNSEAGGTGIDGLQKVASTLVLYESPSSPTPRKQVIKRIHRPGQAERTFVIDLVARRTVDSGILAALQEDMDLYADIMAGKARGSLLDTIAAK